MWLSHRLWLLVAMCDRNCNMSFVVANVWSQSHLYVTIDPGTLDEWLTLSLEGLTRDFGCHVKVSSKKQHLQSSLRPEKTAGTRSWRWNLNFLHPPSSWSCLELIFGLSLAAAFFSILCYLSTFLARSWETFLLSADHFLLLCWNPIQRSAFRCQLPKCFCTSPIG